MGQVKKEMNPHCSWKCDRKQKLHDTVDQLGALESGLDLNSVLPPLCDAVCCAKLSKEACFLLYKMGLIPTSQGYFED